MAQWHRRCPACLGAGLIPSSAGLIPSSAQFDSLWVKESSVATATWIGCNFGLDLIPGPGTPYAAGWPKKKTNKQKTLSSSSFPKYSLCTAMQHDNDHAIEVVQSIFNGQ